MAHELLQPPRVDLAWTATSLTTDFDGYLVYRRASRGSARPWKLIGEIDVPTGYTAATVEAQHTAFVDYEAAWSVLHGQWYHGWDYSVVVRHADGRMSAHADALDRRNQPTGSDDSWLTCNAKPYLNTPMQYLRDVQTDDDDQLVDFRVAGRDLSVTRRRASLPTKRSTFNWQHASTYGEDALRNVRAAAASGSQVAVLQPRGDRWMGTIAAPTIGQNPGPVLQCSAEFVETSRNSAVAGYNLPAGLVLDGTADTVTHPDHDDLDPGTGAFSVVIAAAFTDNVGDVMVAKGDLDVGQVYGIDRSASETLRWRIASNTTNVNVTDNDATWFDGNIHVAIGTNSGTAQALYRDDSQTPVATGTTTLGTTANSDKFSVGSDNDGVDNEAPLAPVIAWAYYDRELSANEAHHAGEYLLGYPGSRMPGGPILFCDLRDDRCWNGIDSTLTNLAEPGMHQGTVVSAPPTRGIPWNLNALDRF